MMSPIDLLIYNFDADAEYKRVSSMNAHLEPLLAPVKVLRYSQGRAPSETACCVGPRSKPSNGVPIMARSSITEPRNQITSAQVLAHPPTGSTACHRVPWRIAMFVGAGADQCRHDPISQTSCITGLLDQFEVFCRDHQSTRGVL